VTSYVYDPEIWLESTIRGIKGYAMDFFDKAIQTAQGPVGLQAYEIVMEFPGPLLDARKVPMRKTVIHFEIDDIISQPAGMSNSLVWTFDPDTNTTMAQEPIYHRMLWDVGIWASDASGGTTSRARAMQILNNAFGGLIGSRALCTFTRGVDGQVDVLRYSGGRFLMDRINDVGVYRMTDATLEVGVYSRTPADQAFTAPAIINIFQDPNLEIIEGTDGTIVPIE